MGKTKEKQEFTLTNPKAMATKGRTYALYCAVGIDCREIDGLTNAMAHNMLNEANGGKAYHVRQQLLDLGGRAAKRDVAREHRDDPKPRKNGKAKAKAEPKQDDMDVKALLKLLKARPELLAGLLEAETEDEDDDDDEDEIVVPEPPKKPKTAKKTKNTPKTAKKAGTKVATKNGTVTINDDDTITDDDLLTMLSKAING